MRRVSTTKVLVVEDVDLEAKLLIRALADAGYSSVEHATDVASAIDKITRDDVRLVITDLALAGSSGLTLTRALRAREQSDYVYVIALTSSAGERQMLEAFDAGVDDFVAKPFDRLALISRLRAGERIVTLENRLNRKSVELERALRRIDVAAAQRALALAAEPVQSSPAAGASPLEAFAGTSSWRELESVLVKVTGEFFQLPFELTPLRSDLSSPFVAEITLAEPAKQLAIGLAAVVELASMKQLSMHLLGEDDLESSQALVLELANTIMGALKHAFTAHDFAFTGGLPSETSLAESRKAFDGSPARARIAMRSGDSHVELWVRCTEKKNTVVRGKMLKEGYVLCQDLRDTRGMLLIRSGTRLTQTTVDRLVTLVPEVEVEVTTPSA
jgi:CheY-like chemotaxis protein